MSITIINYLDHELVNRITEQASTRARASAVSTEDSGFASALAEQTQALASDSVTNTTETAQNPGSASAAGASLGNTGASTNFDSIFNEASRTYGVSASILKAIAKAESGFNPSAVSRAGAIGVMQLMPATAASLGVSNPYDARENIMGGAKYISQLLSKYQGNISLALAAYNAGSGNVDKYGGIPPFKETQNYVPKVLSYMEEFGYTGTSSPSSIFDLTGDARTEANRMLEVFSSKNISKDALDLLAVILKLKNYADSASSGNSLLSGADTDFTGRFNSMQTARESAARQRILVQELPEPTLDLTPTEETESSDAESDPEPVEETNASDAESAMKKEFSRRSSGISEMLDSEVI